MRTTIGKTIMLAITLIGLLFCGNARAQIALLDSPVIKGIANNTTISIPNFTVSSGASVLVVSLLDRNNTQANTGPATLAWGSQTLAKVATVNGAASTWFDCNIYYLYNPTPGQNTITATDTSGGTVSAMVMQAYTLSGVDTSVVPPSTSTTNSSSATTLRALLPSSTPALAWASVCAAYATANLTTTLASSSGTMTFAETNITITEAMGYVANLAAGSSTITENAGSGAGAGKMAIAVAVFAPYFPGPSAPTSVSATGQQGQIALSWVDSSGGLATSYNLLRSTHSGGPYTLVINTASTSYNDISVSTYVPYYYVIQAVDAAGLGLYSAEVNGTATGVPANPPGLAAVAYDTFVVLTWNAATGADNYNVLRSTTSGSGYAPVASGVTTTGYTNTGLANGTTYYYVVQAHNGVGTSGNSTEVSATPQPLAAPTGLAAVGYGSQAGLSWTAPFGATSFNVLRSTTSGSGYASIPGGSGLTSPYFNDTGLITGHTYYYVVQALDAYMTSANSAEASATPQALPPLTGVIAMQDGALNSGMVHVEAGSNPTISPPTISKTVTVTPGASVLVVPFYLQYNNSGTTISDLTPATLAWGGQTLTKAIGELNTGSSSPEGVCAIYYLFNPIPGTHSISFTDTTGKTVWQLAINAYTLNNVDTTITPTALGNQGQFVGSGGLSVTYPSAPFGAFVAAVATSRNGTTRLTSTTGTTNYQYVATPSTPNSSFANQNELMGGVLGLLAGSDTITSGDGGAGTPQSLATAMFTAAIVGPTHPSSLTATSGQTNRIPLSWTDGSGGSATSYIVLRSTANGGPYTSIATNSGNGNVTYLDTSVTAYTTYYYVVQAANAGGASDYSPQASASAVGTPTVPTGLAAVGYGTNVSLAWYVDVTADSYNVFRSTTSGSGYAQIGTVSPGNSPYYTDTGLTTGHTYYYVVQAVNILGTSGNSAEASATPQPLPAPTGQIAVQDGSLTRISNGVTSVTMPVTVSPGANVLVVSLWDKNGQASDLSPSSLTWRDQTLVKMIGTYSTREQAVCGLYYLPDPTPGTGVITAADSLATVMAMQVYTLNNVDNSQTPWAGGASQDFNNSGASANFFGLPGGLFAAMNGAGGEASALLQFVATSGTLTYGTRIIGGDDVGMGAAVNLAAGDATLTETNTHGGIAGVLAAALFPPLILGPSTPINLTGTGETNAIALSWDDSSGGTATSYLVLRSTSSGGGYVTIHTNIGNANVTYTDTSVVNYTTYYYEVKAVNSAGPSAPTAPVSAFAVGISPTPTGLAGQWGNNTATLTWNASPSATSYNVLRSTTSGTGYAQLANVATPGYVDSTVVNFTTYYYVVNAVNDVGTSANSPQVSVTPAASAATIAVWDGSFSPVLSQLNNNSISTSFTVSPGASVLVVSLFDKNSEPNSDLSPATLSWGSQTLTKLRGQVETRDTDVCSIYYLFNPTPGTQTITATDTSTGPVTAMAMQVYTLKGVDVSQTPAGYGHAADFTHPYATDGGNPVNLGAGTPASAFAAMVAEEGNNTLNIHIVASSGTTNLAPQAGLSGASVLMGGVSGLAAGASSIAVSHDSSDGIGTALAVAVFAPAGALPYVQPNAPTILPPYVDATGTNMVVSVRSQVGYRYYLLTTPSLTEPVVWTTNGSAGGTGGIITYLVPISPSQPDLFLKFLVQ
jgi:fibronectin type 3 domain-containing protein